MKPDKYDFIEDTYNVKHREIGGIGTSLTTEGAGKVQWRLTDTKGKEVPIIVECLYVPNLPCRLMCPQQIGRLPSKPGSIPNGAWVGGGRNARLCYDGHVFDFPYDKSSNLPTVKTAVGCNRYCAFISTTAKENDNLTRNQKVLLQLHHRYSHKSMDDIQQWAREGKFNIPIDIC